MRNERGPEKPAAQDLAIASAIERARGGLWGFIQRRVHDRLDAEDIPSSAGSSMMQMTQMMEPMLGRPLDGRELEPFTLSLIEWFRSLPQDAAAQALRTLEDAAATMTRFLDRFDVTLCPTVPVDLYALGTLAPTVDRADLIRRTECLAGYTPVHNIAGVPAMSVPLHISDEGWPIGSHFAAARGREATLLRLAYELEAAAPWRERRPELSLPASSDIR
jgi:amidase